MNKVTNGDGKLLQEINRNLAAIQSSIKDMAKWLRFQNLPNLKQLLHDELSDDAKKLAYENTDGTKGLREVGEMSGVPVPTVQSWWSRWYNLGIVDESPTRKGRMERLCSLRDIGIDVPRQATTRPRVHRQHAAGEESRAITENTLGCEVRADEETQP